MLRDMQRSRPHFVYQLLFHKRQTCELCYFNCIYTMTLNIDLKGECYILFNMFLMCTCKKNNTNMFYSCEIEPETPKIDTQFQVITQSCGDIDHG